MGESSRNMNVAFVNQPWSPVLPPVQSGSISLWTWEVARRLAARHRVVVYEGSRTYSRPRAVRCQGVEYRTRWVGPDELWLRVRRRVGFEGSAIRPTASHWSYYAAYAVQVALDIRREGYDVVHIHQCSHFATIVRALNPNARIFLHMNGEWLTQFDRRLVEPRLGAVDRILGSSNHITNLVRHRYPRTAPRCRTVYNGVDVGKFAPREARSDSPAKQDVKTVVFVGRISPEKGVHDLLDAFRMVAARRSDVELRIVGPECSLPVDFLVGLSDDPLVARLAEFYRGDEYAEYLRRTRVEGAVLNRVTFVGKVANNALPDVYRSADILVNPSLSESFGMTVAEAMACGRAVIVTNVGGMRETVQHGVNGLHVPAADPAALADAILHLLGDDALRESMGRAGRARAVELFSWDKVAEAWIAEAEAAGRDASAAGVHATVNTAPKRRADA